MTPGGNDRLHSVGIVRLRTKDTEFVFYSCDKSFYANKEIRMILEELKITSKFL
jgi:hypothetical protein